MTKQELENLLDSHYKGTLNPDEAEKLIDIYSGQPTEEQSRIFDSYYQIHAKPTAFSKEQKLKIWNEMTRVQQHKSPGYKISNYIKYAAAILLLSLCSTLVYNLWIRNASSNFFSQHADMDSIFLRKYDGIRLTVIYPDGSSRAMNQQDWTRYGISLDSNILTIAPSMNEEPKQENSICVKTEKGQTQMVKLMDGTRVWLNSNAQLTVPSSYAKDYRKTALIGEAYFEVVPKKNHPFEVHTTNNITRVLGTHFNIDARPQQIEKATLIEGAVQVYNKKAKLLLIPGEQAIGNDNLTKVNANIARVMDWKNGDFYFDDIRIEELMDIIDEWYDVKYFNYSHKSKDRFSGIFKRTNSLEELLNNLEMVSSLRFVIKEGGIHVLNK